MAGLLYDDAPNALFHFVVLTLILGGAGAIASGRAVAGSWKSYLILPLYMLILSAAVQFLHYALFQEDLLSVRSFVTTLAFTLLAAGYGYRNRRADQMDTQYSWLYAKSGPLGWKAKSS